MFTQSMPQLAQALSGALPDDALRQLMQSLGNCQQPLTHRGAVNIQAPDTTGINGLAKSGRWNPATYRDIMPNAGDGGYVDIPGSGGNSTTNNYNNNTNNYAGNQFSFPTNQAFNYSNYYGGDTINVEGNTTFGNINTTTINNNPVTNVNTNTSVTINNNFGDPTGDPPPQPPPPWPPGDPPPLPPWPPWPPGRPPRPDRDPDPPPPRPGRSVTALSNFPKGKVECPTTSISVEDAEVELTGTVELSIPTGGYVDSECNVKLNGGSPTKYPFTVKGTVKLKDYITSDSDTQTVPVTDYSPPPRFITFDVQ
jgi:hypothetical protein